MQTKGKMARLASTAAVALVALAVLPVLAASASAAPIAPSAAMGPAASAEWAYGGQGWNAGAFSFGKASFTWNSSAGVDVILNATNTSANTTELTATRTVVVSVTATYTGPYQTWAFKYKAAEDDHAYANVTNASTVQLNNGSTVAALGILNASLRANATVAASLTGAMGNKSVSDYLNVSGWAKAQVAFTPALGLVPLNLTGVSSWTSSASAAGSAAWNVSWSFVNHGWNNTSASHSGDVNGTWSTVTEVTLIGQVAGAYAHWIDHRARTAIGLSLHGPFDLYAGVLLVPHDFDQFRGSGGASAQASLGAGVLTTEYLYVNAGRLSARAVTAANMTASASTPAPPVVASAGTIPTVAVPQASSPGATVWEQPMSPQAAASQANCLQYGCAAGPNALRGLIVPLAIVGVAAVVAVALILGTRSRGRGGQRADQPLAAAPGPTPPTGVGPFGPSPPTP